MESILNQLRTVVKLDFRASRTFLLVALPPIGEPAAYVGGGSNPVGRKNPDHCRSTL